jgi:hypothetical protein
MNKKPASIKYTSRDFNRIKSDLVEYSKRYYPDTYSNFNKASFGSLFLDTVSYVGDVLSFYVDYQFNESMLNTAVEFDNILKISKQLGYKYNPRSTAYGFITLYVSVPADNSGLGPDTNYLPILNKGSSFAATGGQLFTLLQDVDFSESTNEIVVATVDQTTGVPTRYAIKAIGIVQSGFLTQKIIDVGNYERFKKIDLQDSNVLEIVSVFDQEGNEYFEVDHLSQDVIFREIPNNNFQQDGVPSIIKPFPVPRRFSVDKTNTTTVLQFGYGSEDELSSTSVVEPSQTVLQLQSKRYFSETSFDPTNLIKSDKFGVSPSNTSLTVTYRKSNGTVSNSAAGTITKVRTATFKFPNFDSTTASERNIIQNSLEINNEEPMTGETRLDAAEELKMNTMDFYASQNRAVSLLDYQALIYSMPSNFGRIKRCAIYQDNKSFKRNINLYVVSQTNDSKLITANAVVKSNLKTWLSQYKMINDTIDIIDAKIVNYGIEFNIVVDSNYDRAEVLSRALTVLQTDALNIRDIGESISISDIYKTLNSKIDGVIDTTYVKIVPKLGGIYSDVILNFDDQITFDGRSINCPKNVIFEVKYPAIDIKGTVS